LSPAKNNANEQLAKARALRQTLAPYNFDADEMTAAIKDGRA
jgi:hypothetical protein